MTYKGFSNLLIVSGYFHSHAKGLVAFVTGRTRKAVESWVSVHAVLFPTDFKAQIRHQITLQRNTHRDRSEIKHYS